DLVEQYLKKGHQVYVEGHLRMDEWTGQGGQKRSKLKIVVDNLQFLERRQDGGGGGGGEGGGYRRQSASSSPRAAAPDPSYDMPDDAGPPPSGPSGEDIPF